ncbi:hypothetical protein EKK58_01485 [Candidatus Dependentiae bacterium]|nr:MAG: hypothetical protein EKK58_01485 [Candidatus Dependentiae bacterium]
MYVDVLVNASILSNISIPGINGKDVSSSSQVIDFFSKKVEDSISTELQNNKPKTSFTATTNFLQKYKILGTNENPYPVEQDYIENNPAGQVDTFFKKLWHTFPEDYYPSSSVIFKIQYYVFRYEQINQALTNNLNKIKEISTSNTTLKAENIDLKKEIASLKQDNEKLKKEKEKLETSLLEIKQIGTSLESKLKNASEKVQGETVSTTDTLKLKKINSTERKTINEQMKKIKELEAQVKRLESEVQSKKLNNPFLAVSKTPRPYSYWTILFFCTTIFLLYKQYYRK